MMKSGANECYYVTSHRYALVALRDCTLDVVERPKYCVGCATDGVVFQQEANK
jgi:hypothetical protein